MVTPKIGVGKTRSCRGVMMKYTAREPREEPADAQAGGTWDRVPRPDPA